MSANGNPAKQLTCEVPDTVQLPEWLNPRALAVPDALEIIRAEAAAVEADFIVAATAVCDTLRRMLVVRTSAYAATNPGASNSNAPDIPDEVIDAVEAAIGVDRLDILESWLTGFVGTNGAPTEKQRIAMFEKYGDLVAWDDDIRKACDTLFLQARAVDETRAP